MNRDLGSQDAAAATDRRRTFGVNKGAGGKDLTGTPGTYAPGPKWSDLPPALPTDARTKEVYDGEDG